MPTPITLLGLVASFLSAIMFLPQVLKCWQTRSAAGLAWGTLLTSSSCVLLWLIYGSLIRDTPLIVGNALNLVFTLSLVVFKIRFKDAEPVVIIERP